MKKTYLFILFSLILSSCKKEKADLIVINSNTYTVNNNFDKVEAFAIKDGKFIAVGSSKEIQEKYKSAKIIDAKNKQLFLV